MGHNGDRQWPLGSQAATGDRQNLDFFFCFPSFELLHTSGGLVYRDNIFLCYVTLIALVLMLDNKYYITSAV